MADIFCNGFLHLDSVAENPLYSSYIANCVMNAFSSYTAIMLNILTIYAMRKTSSLPKPLKTLLLSLAVSDLGVGLLVQPLYIALMVKWLQGNTEHSPTCAMYTASLTVFCFFSSASFLGILAISVDRFLAIHLHLRYQELVTQKRVVAMVILIWVLSALLSLIDLRVTKITSLVITVLSSFCFICTTIVYFKIYSAVRRHTIQIQTLQVHQVAQNFEMENIARLRKSAFSTFYVYLVFLVCYLPEHCTLVLSIIFRPSTTLVGAFLYTWTLVFLNSSLNPVIYCWKMRHIRQAVMNVLRNRFTAQN
ncbi:beta-4C adrenergic receptor-like [Oculina patagonica]